MCLKLHRFFFFLSLKVNVDNNCVGFYQSMYLGSFCTQTLIDNQFSYQVQRTAVDAAKKGFRHEFVPRRATALFGGDMYIPRRNFSLFLYVMARRRTKKRP